MPHSNNRISGVRGLGFEILKRLYDRGGEAFMYELFPERSNSQMPGVYRQAHRLTDMGYLNDYDSENPTPHGSMRPVKVYELTESGIRLYHELSTPVEEKERPRVQAQLAGNR